MQKIIQSLLYDCNLTQDELADMLDVSQATVNHLYCSRRYPSYPTLVRVIHLAFTLLPELDLVALFKEECRSM